jgi:hypothetical protein
MRMWLAAVALVVSSALGSISPAHAETTCWDDHKGEPATVTGVINDPSQGDGGWSFMTDINLADGCSVWEVFGDGSIPEGCEKGDNFTAEGVIDASDDMMDFLEPEDDVVGVYASSVTCS